MIEFTLIPRRTQDHKGKYFTEQVEIVTYGYTEEFSYPLAFMHIDTFYGDRKIYDQLCNGNKVKVFLTLCTQEGENDGI